MITCTCRWAATPAWSAPGTRYVRVVDPACPLHGDEALAAREDAS